jgi:DNA-binding NarL/FixJ family response regulator
MKEILIIEDARGIRETYKRKLRQKGEFNFAEAATAEAATTWLNSMSFDHVICDYNLDQGTGRDVFYWLQENKPEQLKRFTFVCGMPSELSDLDATVFHKLDHTLYEDILTRIQGGTCE